MSTTADLKTIRLTRAAQWQTGLASGLRVLARAQDRHAWQVIPPFTNQASLLHSPGFASDSAYGHARPWLGTDPQGSIWWRDRAGALHEIHDASSADTSSPVCAVPRAAVVHHAQRIVFGRSWLYSANDKQIARHDAASLQPDALFEFDAKVLDITSDADDGLYILLHSEVQGQGGFFLQRLCANGKLLARIALPYQLHPAMITYLAHSRTCIALSSDGEQIGVVDADGNCITRRLATMFAKHPDFSAFWLDGDRLGRFVLLGKDAASKTYAWVCDAAGDVLASVPAEGALAACLAGPMLYLMTENALLRVPQAQDGGQSEVQAVNVDPITATNSVRGRYLTPLLHSPRKASESGWLRAHIEALLPAGASMHVTVLRCDDAHAVAISREVAADFTKTPAQRIDALSQLQDWQVSARYDFAAKVANGAKPQASVYEIPLFDDDAQWCRLLIELAAAPLSGLPQLESCTVLYPNISLMQYLPAIFNGGSIAENRPGSSDPFLRMLVGVWESQTQGLDQVIAQSGARIHPDTAPTLWLDFLARKLGCPWHDGLPIDAKRRILQAADALAQARGTRHGLALLLRALLPEVRHEVLDRSVEHGLLTLAAAGTRDAGQIAGSRLPAVLAGLPVDAAKLSHRAVLGSMRLASAKQIPSVSDAYQRFLGQVSILLHCPQDATLAEILPGILNNILPAGVQVDIKWRAESPVWQLESKLEDVAAGRLNQSLRLNRSTLSGKRKAQLPAGGILPGFHLS